MNPHRPTAAAYRRSRRAAGTAERVGRFAQVQAAATSQSAQGSTSEAADYCLCFAALKSVTLFLVTAKIFGQVVRARRRSDTIPLPKCRVIRHNLCDIMRLIERSRRLKSILGILTRLIC